MHRFDCTTGHQPADLVPLDPLLRRAGRDAIDAQPCRQPRDVSFGTGTPEQIAETMIGYRRVGFHTFICELPAPYDVETMETLVKVVKPMVERVT